MTPPLRPTGWHAIDDFGHTTATRPAMLTDEWAEGHLTPEAAPRLTHEELVEGLRRLDEVSDLVGHIPAEIMAGLRNTMVRRNGTAAMWLRLLRSLDEEARGA